MNEPNNLIYGMAEAFYYTPAEGNRMKENEKEVKAEYDVDTNVSKLVKLKNGANGATHRVIVADAPGRVVPILPFMGIQPPSFTWEVTGVAEIADVVGDSRLHFHFKLESTAGKVKANVFDPGQQPIN